MSFSHLATVGTLSYNGYTFDGASGVKASVEFVKDEAGRTIIYHRHTIEVHTFVSNSSTTDTDVESIRELLSHQGKELRFVNKGFGDDLIVNTANGSGLRDVKWGPTPETLYWEPVGGANACEVIWKVTTCVPVCVQSTRTTGVMAINWGASVSIDYRGLTTRTISGYIEIAQTRTAAKAIPDSADNYRYLVQPDLPNGFQREQEWSLSPDKSRIEFTLTDHQLPTRNPYPNLVTRISGRHRVAWNRNRRESVVLRNSITLDIELAMGAPLSLPWRVFGALVRQRIEFAEKNGRQAFLDEIVAEEDIFGLSHSFAASYRLLVGLPDAMNSQNPGQPTNTIVSDDIFDFIKCGLWLPTNGNWSQWKSSVSHTYFERGLAGLTFPAQNDVIVDLCGIGTTVPWTGTQPPPTQFIRLQEPIIKNKKPPPRRSYLTYKQRIAIRREKYSARQKKLQADVADGASGDMFAPDGLKLTGGGTDDTINTSGIASHKVALVGHALRAGYEVPRPVLKSIGGQTATEEDAFFVSEQVGIWFGVPVFNAQWAITYDLPNAPSNVSSSPKLEA